MEKNKRTAKFTRIKIARNQKSVIKHFERTLFWFTPHTVELATQH